MAKEDQGPYVTITNGLRGYFAVLLTWCDGMYEPWETGSGSYRRQADAVPEAVAWARAEDIPFKLSGYTEDGKLIESNKAGARPS